MIERTTEGNQVIQAYGLDVLLEELQELVQRGYVLDYATNEHYPQAIGHLYVVTLVPAAGKQVIGTAEARLATETPVVTPELKALQDVIEEGKGKPGRKAKTTA